MATYDVLNGPVPPGSAVVTGSGGDELTGLQLIMDNLSSGDIVDFPTPPTSYGVSGNLTITVDNVTLRSTGWSSGTAIGNRYWFEGTTGVHGGAKIEQLIAATSDYATILINADDVTIDGLYINGPGSADPNGKDMYGVSFHASGSPPATGTYHGLTVMNCMIDDVGGMGVEVSGGDDIVIKNNFINHCVYMGVNGTGSRRVHVLQNRVALFGADNTEDDTYVEAGGYGINVSARSAQEAEDWVVAENIMEDGYIWYALSEHGCTRYHAWRNYVYNCHRGTQHSGGQTAADTYPDANFVNNEWDSLTERSAGSPEEVGVVLLHNSTGTVVNSRFIGNIMDSCGTTQFYDITEHDGLRFCWNELNGYSPTSNIVDNGSNVNHYVQKNFDDTVEDNGDFATGAASLSAPTPTGLTATVTSEGVQLDWDAIATDHDSVYVEVSRVAGGGWVRLFYAPPMWRDSSSSDTWGFTVGASNAHFAPYDTTTVLDRAGVSGDQYRISTTRVETVSTVSGTATATSGGPPFSSVDVFTDSSDGSMTAYSLISVKDTTGDPTGVAGRLVANSVDKTVRLYVNDAWVTLATWT